MQKNTKKQTESPKLFRSENNKMLAGVCGGLSQYFSVDATLIRCAFVLLSLFGGAGPLIYLILWIVVPSETSTVTNPNDVMRENAKEMKEKPKYFRKNLQSNRVQTIHDSLLELQF
jgi:phage shock protein PspC (stress-responsive transcriptional regulator)